MLFGETRSGWPGGLVLFQTGAASVVVLSTLAPQPEMLTVACTPVLRLFVTSSRTRDLSSAICAETLSAAAAPLRLTASALGSQVSWIILCTWPALFQPHGKVRARPGPSGEALSMAAPCKRHVGNDATRSLRV